MTVDSNGIVLKHTLFGDNDIIVKILTENLGLISFMVKGGKKSNKRKYLQPLMIVSISFKYNIKRNIQYLNKITLKEVTSEILNNPQKSIISLFLCEIISKSLKEGSEDKEAYDFLFNQILWLNKKNNSILNFDVWFLAHFSKILGISPNFYDVNKNSVKYFNPESGSFSDSTESRNWDHNKSLILFNLLNIEADKLKDFHLNNNLTKFVLKELINYYDYHLNNLNLNKCLDVYNSLKI
tara:strand:+ start:860 stop:1576 length:717 start_codon:yes stop_codon:yes gene_type:complete